MSNGVFKLGKYNIGPKTSIEILDENKFNIVNVDGDKVYLSNTSLDLCGLKFWVSIYSKDSFIKKIDLSNADSKFKMDYQSINEEIIQELKSQNDNFLFNNFGEPSTKTISGIEYNYSWGKILSYFDNKSAQAGIVIIYF